MLMTHLSFASSSMAATTSDNVARTVSASNASNSSSLSSSQSAVSSSVHSSSLSSLFERVTNFRRSLIKNQARSKHKSATRYVLSTLPNLLNTLSNVIFVFSLSLLTDLSLELLASSMVKHYKNKILLSHKIQRHLHR